MRLPKRPGYSAFWRPSDEIKMHFCSLMKYFPLKHSRNRFVSLLLAYISVSCAAAAQPLVVYAQRDALVSNVRSRIRGLEVSIRFSKTEIRWLETVVSSGASNPLFAESLAKWRNRVARDEAEIASLLAQLDNLPPILKWDPISSLLDDVVEWVGDRTGVNVERIRDAGRHSYDIQSDGVDTLKKMLGNPDNAVEFEKDFWRRMEQRQEEMILDVVPKWVRDVYLRANEVDSLGQTERTSNVVRGSLDSEVDDLLSKTIARADEKRSGSGIGAQRLTQLSKVAAEAGRTSVLSPLLNAETLNLVSTIAQTQLNQRNQNNVSVPQRTSSGSMSSRQKCMGCGALYFNDNDDREWLGPDICMPCYLRTLPPSKAGSVK